MGANQRPKAQHLDKVPAGPSRKVYTVLQRIHYMGRSATAMAVRRRREASVSALGRLADWAANQLTRRRGVGGAGVDEGALR